MFLMHVRCADIELVQKVADVLDHKSNCLAVFDLERGHVILIVLHQNFNGA